MLHLFVVNPAAGRKSALPQIQGALERFPHLDAKIYETAGPGDATRYLRAYLGRNKAPVRLYACGGDGTLSEVVNGAAGFPQASVGCYPCGSGNDFVKYYGGAEAFLDIPSLISGVETPIDMIRVNDRYAINACHFGLDTAVARTMNSVKKYPFMNGRRAYLAGVANALLRAMRSSCSLSVDGELLHSGDFLLCTIANGTHVGGSYRCAPRSLDDDGLLEVCLVRTVSRFRFFQLNGAYKRGEHLNDPRFHDCLLYRQAHTAHLEGPEGFCISLDGELFPGRSFDIEALPRALRFIVPHAQAIAHDEKPLAV